MPNGETIQIQIPNSGLDNGGSTQPNFGLPPLGSDGGATPQPNFGLPPLGDNGLPGQAPTPAPAGAAPVVPAPAIDLSQPPVIQ